MVQYCWAQLWYSIPDKEALTIVKGLQNWRHWLEHMKLPIQILTDHKNLKYFTKPWVLNRWQMHWLELLTLQYEIHYQPRDKNCRANVLSQCTELHPPDIGDEKPLCLIPKTKFIKIAVCEVELTLIGRTFQTSYSQLSWSPMCTFSPKLEGSHRVGWGLGMGGWIGLEGWEDMDPMMVFGRRLWDFITIHCHWTPRHIWHDRVGFL